MPIFVEGEICYVADKCHWSEMGGKDPGYSLNATEIYQEGLQMPCVKLFNEGVLNEDIADIIRPTCVIPTSPSAICGPACPACAPGGSASWNCAPSTARTPSGPPSTAAQSSAEYSRKQVEKIPDGVYRAEDVMDKDVHGNGPFHVQVAVTVKGDRMTVDFTGTDKQTAGPHQPAPGGGSTPPFPSVFWPARPGADVTTGVFEPLEIIAEEGSLFNAIRPAPVSCYYESMQVALDLVWQAMAPVVKKGQLTAGHFLTVGAYTMNGIHAVTGQPFVNCGPPWAAGRRL